MAVSRKRSGFVNDTRAYCYPDCNKITLKKEIFPSISQCQSCNSNKRGLNLNNVYTSSLGINNSINGNINTRHNYNIRFI